MSAKMREGRGLNGMEEKPGEGRKSGEDGQDREWLFLKGKFLGMSLTCMINWTRWVRNCLPKATRGWDLQSHSAVKVYINILTGSLMPLFGSKMVTGLFNLFSPHNPFRPRAAVRSTDRTATLHRPWIPANNALRKTRSITSFHWCHCNAPTGYAMFIKYDHDN